VHIFSIDGALPLSLLCTETALYLGVILEWAHVMDMSPSYNENLTNTWWQLVELQQTAAVVKMESCSGIGSESIVKKRKKGIKNPELYKFNVIKEAGVKGTEYMNNAGKSIPKHSTGPPWRSDI
jgi:hypothetical protein